MYLCYLFFFLFFVYIRLRFPFFSLFLFAWLSHSPPFLFYLYSSLSNFFLISYMAWFSFVFLYNSLSFYSSFLVVCFPYPLPNRLDFISAFLLNCLLIYLFLPQEHITIPFNSEYLFSYLTCLQKHCHLILLYSSCHHHFSNLYLFLLLHQSFLQTLFDSEILEKLRIYEL